MLPSSARKTEAQPTIPSHPQSLYEMVKQYDPLIATMVQRYTGSTPSPTVMQRARILAAQAIKSYQPSSKVPIQNWISHNLIKIKNVQKAMSDIISVPESLRREAAALQKAEEELRSKLNREPSYEELADYTGIPVKKQKRLRRGVFTVSESAFSAVDDDTDEDSDAGFLGVSKRDLHNDALTYIYHDSDDIDKIILQHRFGYRNAPILQSQEIAKKVNLSPAAVTKRVNRLTNRYNEVISWLR